MDKSMSKTLYMGADHAGLTLKKTLIDALGDTGWTVEDLGAYAQERCDYPDFAHRVCDKVLETGSFGILICGTGIGMAITANRHKGIRAALCTHEFHARAARGHNNANVLCLGERVTAPGLAVDLAGIFLATAFEGGRHTGRINKIEL